MEENKIYTFKTEELALEFLIKRFKELGCPSLLSKFKPEQSGKREWQPIEVANMLMNLRNRAWRMDNLYKIRDKNQETIVFRMNRIQRFFDENKHTRNIIAKTRQVGITTYKAIDQLDKTLFEANQNCILVAHREDAAAEIFRTKIEFAWNNLHPLLHHIFKIKSKKATSIEFDRSKNGADISSISTDTSARSGTFSSMHISELAYLDKYFPERSAEILSGAIPAVPPAGQLDIESTARGNIGQFHDRFYQATQDPKSPKQFKSFFFPWTMDDTELDKVTEEQIRYVRAEEGEEWDKFKDYKEMHSLSDREIAFYYFTWDSMGRDWDKMKEEYPTTVEEAFSASEERIFPAEKLRGKEKAPIRVSAGWHYFENPQPGHRYIIGGDPSEGVGRDASGAVIINLETNDIAATFIRDDIEPDLFGVELVVIGKFFNGAFLAIEKNNSGYATLSKVREMYDQNRVYKEVLKDKLWDNKTNKFGWRTSAHNKQKMVYDFKSAVVAEQVGLKCARLIGELLLYTKDEVVKVGRVVTRLGSSRNAKGHSDLATAAFIAWQAKGEALKFLPIGKESDKRLELLKLKKSLTNYQ